MFRPRKPFLSTFLLATVLCACAGCAGRTRVEGSVTLDGKPVDGGLICFFQGTGPGSDKGNAAIQGGRYVVEGDRAVNLTPGSYTVQIFWQQKLGGSNPANADTSPAVKQLIPPQYNTKSALKAEVKSGTNKLDFDLKSK
jgi:hypothetical protein